MVGIDLKEEWEKHKANKEISEEEAQLFKSKHILDVAPKEMKSNSEIAEHQLGIPKEHFKQLLGEENLDENFKQALKETFNNKIRLAEQFWQMQPIYYDDGGSFWLWNGFTKSWKRIERDEDIANKIHMSLQVDTINSKERGEIFQALKQVARMHTPKELPKTWIQFKNGIIDIKNPIVIIEPTPNYFTVNPIPHNLGSSDSTPNMDKIFEQWVGKDYIQTLYEILSYCLLPSYPIHRLFCFIGSGMNGKSKFLELLKNFIGCNNVTSTELDVLLGSRFEVTRLYKKLVCQMGETNFSEMSKTSILKKLTGQDLIGFEYKNKTPFESMNYAKIIISTNNLPATTDKTVGFYRRWLILDFPNQFTEHKNILDDIPQEEYENLAFKSIKILNELLTKKEFHKEGSIEERMERYEAKSNFIETFIKNFTTESFDGYITKVDFYKKFNDWSKENRHREMSETSVGITMKKNGMQEDKKYFDWLYDGKGGQCRVWSGIKWK